MKITAIAEDWQCLSSAESVPARSKKPIRRSRIYLTVAVLSIAFTTSSTAMAKDPCKTVLCMYGMFTGNSGGSECTSAEKDYFSIVVKKKGKIRWSDTANARQEYLDSCPKADRGISQKINDKFGKTSG
ncbi:TrbM/KikA/MpfK family conjugal transfer protein [Pseudomonas fragariae (ex Marin et al. 2024)]|uniref:TrbM/KikA/MpfK family conjugal transfer protein n=1 Tax=Pseudomonas fragariae (ex Marin et al. 2024) TaxID=3080056 RepID=UPI003F7A3829